MNENPVKRDELVRTWRLPYAARLGSSVRSQGLYLAVRSMLPNAARKSLAVQAGELTLRMPRDAAKEFAEASKAISTALQGIESRPVIPREIEDILGISTGERRRWLADGRLPSWGTRTIRLKGRGTITFHVFDPRVVEDILDRSLVDAWRADDAERAAENRRRKTELLRGRQKNVAATASTESMGEERGAVLHGWAEFERNGPWR